MARLKEFFALWKQPNFRQFATSVGVFIAYILAAKLSLAIQSVDTFAAPLWVPSGIALAALLLWGYRLWPSIALGAFLVNLSLGTGAVTAAVIAAGNTLEALVGAYALNLAGFSPYFRKLRDSLAILLAALFMPLIAATIGAGSLVLGGTLPGSAFGGAWFTLWIGDGMGILALAPLLLKWLSTPYFKRTRGQYVEFVLIVVGVAASALLIFWSPLPRFAYLIIIPLAWAALRIGPRGTTLSLFLLLVISASGTLSGHGPFASLPEGFLYLELFLATIGGIFLIFVSVVEEMRDSKKALEEDVEGLRHNLDKVSSEDKAKSEFLAILAHELRNPLAAVLSSTELLKLEGAASRNAPALLEEIDRRARAMGRLLEDLLDLSRVSKLEFKLNRAAVSLGSVIDQSVRTAAPLMSARHHSFLIERPKQDLYVLADPIRLEQVFVNLLSNAAKYTEPGGSVTLSAERERGSAVVRVRDTGIGIPKRMQNRVFEAFFQAEGAKKNGEGLGIGLSLTRRLVELHGGTIEVESEGEGKGSEFSVRLPLTAPAKPSADPHVLRANRALRQAKMGRRMLIVDDNEAAADGLARLLSMRGHEAVVAYSGEEGLARAHELKPEVIILDIGLPGMDGYEVARTLRREKYPGLLVALTGYGLTEDKEKAMQAGFDRHLTKPVGLKEVEAALRRAPRAAAAAAR